MVKKFFGGAAAVSVASIFVLAGCSGLGRMTPSVPGGAGMGSSVRVPLMIPDAGAAIVYKGPKVAKKPELDLYSTTVATPGYTLSFTATQKGNTKPFTYAFATVKGFTNNCPNAKSKAARAYLVSPASGKPAKKGKYTVKVAGASAPAGECAMTLTGASKKTLKVLLTFTTSGVVVGQPKS